MHAIAPAVRDEEAGAFEQFQLRHVLRHPEVGGCGAGIYSPAGSQHATAGQVRERFETRLVETHLPGVDGSHRDEDQWGLTEPLPGKGRGWWPRAGIQIGRASCRGRVEIS